MTRVCCPSRLKYSLRPHDRNQLLFYSYLPNLDEFCQNWLKYYMKFFINFVGLKGVLVSLRIKLYGLFAKISFFRVSEESLAVESLC